MNNMHTIKDIITFHKDLRYKIVEDNILKDMAVAVTLRNRLSLILVNEK